MLQEELGIQIADTVVGADGTARVLVTNCLGVSHKIKEGVYEPGKLCILRKDSGELSEW